MKEVLSTIKAIESQSLIQIPVARITALWAFSEATLGGILHALSIPLRGAFINAASVLFISLIGLFSKRSKEVLKSTLIVILVKAIVSPHSPLTAYLAVSIQGFIGFILFYNKKFFKVSALILGILTLLFSGIQKIIVLTVLFGNTLWKSINIFTQSVVRDFSVLGIENGINYSLILILVYISIHLVIGVIAGLYAGKLPEKIEYFSKSLPKININHDDDNLPKKEKKRKQKVWLLRPTGILIILFSLSSLFISFVSPELNDTRFEILIMIIRAISLTILWYAVLAPVVRKIFQKFLEKNKSKHSTEINEMIELFPQFRKIVAYCWKESQSDKGIRRIKLFLSRSFYYLLLSY
ncbi:hypothetical protein [Ignavibacterium sp.]|uniref:hypothetical protein n=1 Tax=Ignavibacterium sp. TaxID=2651167 RepID=UPI00307F7BAD